MDLSIYTQDKKDLIVQINNADDATFYPVTYDGRTYAGGDKASAFNFSRDWWYAFMDKIIAEGDPELDSAYTRAFVLSLMLLYDFAVDSEMKRKAKMTLDFLLLESILDVSADLYCGMPGRTYGHLILEGHPQVYWRVFWGIGSYDPGSVLRNFYDAYISTYRLPEVIEDIGVLEDEPDNYWHLNLENNRASYISKKLGKRSYITKYFNLGGTDMGWTLNIRSGTDEGDGIRLWINREETIGDMGWGTYAGDETYLTVGEYGYQYKNAMFIKCGTPYLHVQPMEDNSFDLDQTVSGWRFLVEGKTAVAIKFGTRSQALEAVILGVDYPDFNAFKDAILTKADLQGGYYRTSKGVMVYYVYDQTTYEYTTYAGSQVVYEYPFKRVEATTHTGEKMVYWNGKKMYVQHHGKKLTYDFDNWTYSESSDVDAPAAPQGVNVTGAD